MLFSEKLELQKNSFFGIFGKKLDIHGDPSEIIFLVDVMQGVTQTALDKSSPKKSSKKDFDRIAKHLKSGVLGYEKYWKEFINNFSIMEGDRRIYDRIEAAISSIKALPNDPSVEEVHATLKKVNLAANALIQLQQIQIDTLNNVNLNLQQRNSNKNEELSVVKNEKQILSIENSLLKKLKKTKVEQDFWDDLNSIAEKTRLMENPPIHERHL